MTAHGKSRQLMYCACSQPAFRSLCRGVTSWCMHVQAQRHTVHLCLCLGSKEVLARQACQAIVLAATQRGTQALRAAHPAQLPVKAASVILLAKVSGLLQTPESTRAAGHALMLTVFLSCRDEEDRQWGRQALLQAQARRADGDSEAQTDGAHRGNQGHRSGPWAARMQDKYGLDVRELGGSPGGPPGNLPERPPPEAHSTRCSIM